MNIAGTIKLGKPEIPGTRRVIIARFLALKGHLVSNLKFGVFLPTQAMVTHRGLNPPHILLASSNPMQMIRNLHHLLDHLELSKLTAELDRNVALLLALGEGHYAFAVSVSPNFWRQKISRFYYAVYNARRAVALKHSGAFSTDSSDHKNIDQLPDGIANREAHMISLRNLREDRNLADYNHLAVVHDLVIRPADALAFATQFMTDCRQFLVNQGVVL